MACRRPPSCCLLMWSSLCVCEHFWHLCVLLSSPHTTELSPQHVHKPEWALLKGWPLRRSLALPRPSPAKILMVIHFQPIHSARKEEKHQPRWARVWPSWRSMSGSTSPRHSVTVGIRIPARSGASPCQVPHAPEAGPASEDTAGPPAPGHSLPFYSPAVFYSRGTGPPWEGHKLCTAREEVRTPLTPSGALQICMMSPIAPHSLVTRGASAYEVIGNVKSEKQTYFYWREATLGKPCRFFYSLWFRQVWLLLAI